MSSGQMTFILGAFTLLSLLALNVNRTMYGSLILGLEMEATLNALSIGQSMLDEIEQKNFDQKTIGNIAYNPGTDLTQLANLGPETGEAISGYDSAYTVGGIYHDFQSATKFNDVDDYNGYTRKVWDSRLGYFTVTDSVIYAVESNANQNASSATFYKRLVVVVTHPNLPKAADGSTMPVILRDLKVYRQFF